MVHVFFVGGGVDLFGCVGIVVVDDMVGVGCVCVVCFFFFVHCCDDVCVVLFG